MMPHHSYYQLAMVGLLWLCVLLHSVWPSRGAVSPPPPVHLVPPPLQRKRSNEPTPFVGLTQRRHCALCEHEATHPEPQPPRRPAPMAPTQRRPCAIDTSMHFCPHAGCDDRGWLGLGNLRANGHPSGGLWRQLYCHSWQGYFLETHDTILHGKHLAVERIMRVLACLAEGLGMRAMARVLEVDPQTVLPWLVEAAEQLQAFTRYVLCDMHIKPLPLDEVYAVRRGVKDGEISEANALKRLEPARPWVWTAIDPVSKLLLAIAVGPRTGEMAQRVVHQVARRLASTCMPLWFSDGCKGSLPAILDHCGWWVHPERRHDKGPVPKPRWRPLPCLLSAQIVKQYRRKRVAGVKHRMVFGTREAIESVLASCGWKINTSFVERLHLDIRPRVAAVGRRVNTRCMGKDGLQHQLAVFHVYHNLVLSHASLRQPLLAPEATNGSGSVKVWQPWTPAMAAGWTDHVWTLQEVLMFRGPP